MSIWGKIIGSVAGFALGGPLGALIGAAAGHAVDHARAQGVDNEAKELPPGSGTGDRSAREIAFSVAVIVLGAKMAKADGVVTRVEVDAFKEVFRVPAQEMKNVARIFDAAKRDAAGFEPYARQVAHLFRDDPVVLEELLAGLYHIARADGSIRREEMAYLQKVATIFGLGPDAFDRIQAPFNTSDAVDPYGVLGISRSATDVDIKAKYRTLIRENHPDVLMAKGMPQDFIDLANERMAAINAAYDQIEKERGLK